MRRWIETLAVLCFLALTPFAIAQEANDEIRVSDEPATLVWHNREIVTFRAEIDQFGPRERVRSALGRLNDLEIGGLVPEVRTRYILGAATIQAGTQPLFTIVRQDLAQGQTLEEASAIVEEQLNDAFAAYVATHGRGFLLRAATRAAIATVVFLVVFLILMRLGAAILRRIPAPDDPKFSRLEVTGFSLGPYAAAAVRALARLTFLVIELFAIYVWVTYVLAIFPYTRPWSDAAAGFLLETFRELGLGALHGIPGLITVIVIFWVPIRTSRVPAPTRSRA